jgi:co-chaperonin GroES (HSP10)
MKAVGNNIIIEKLKEGTTSTKGGLFLAESHREDIRYVEGKVISLGSDVAGIKENDVIFFDRHAGHKIEIKKESFHVIKMGDVVVVV